MKILLLGEFSNVHWTLAEGLRKLGHDVVVVSDGDRWKNYPRDIELRRRSLGKWDTFRYIWNIERTIPKLKGYDIVQIINPVFLDLKAQRIRKFYDKLRSQNKKMFMGAFGMDKYWVKCGLDCSTFRYSDFNIGRDIRHNEDNTFFIQDWLDGPKGELNDYIANDCDGIISGLCEYDMCYRQYFPNKTTHIPFPIKCQEDQNLNLRQPGKVSFFIGIQHNRNAYKGTDIMYKALLRLKQEYPDKVIVNTAENVPFAEYIKLLNNSDVLLDQLYSYTPGMNGLQAMSQGLIVVGGGEDEMYRLLNERELQPIINVLPNEDDVYKKLKDILLNMSTIPQRKQDSISFINKHHDYIKVAQLYIDAWEGSKK